jgi:hypothetical protein
MQVQTVLRYEKPVRAMDCYGRKRPHNDTFFPFVQNTSSYFLELIHTMKFALDTLRTFIKF